MRDGVYTIDKPSGISSFAVVRSFQKAFNSKAFGHAGTLDPLASGVLVILAGSATKLSPYLLENDKTYEAGIILGETSDTLDVTGLVTRLAPPELDEITIRQALSGMTGTLELVPPDYSAIHVAGQRAYMLARKGLDVTLAKKSMPVKDVRFSEAHRSDDGLWHVTARFAVGKGTYVRSLAQELGTRLGTAGILERLVRLSSGPFTLDDAMPLSSLTAETLPMFTLAQALAARGMRLVTIAGEELFCVDNGKPLSTGKIPAAADEEVIALVSDGMLRGVYRLDGSGKQWRAERVWK